MYGNNAGTPGCRADRDGFPQCRAGGVCSLVERGITKPSFLLWQEVGGRAQGSLAHVTTCPSSELIQSLKALALPRLGSLAPHLPLVWGLLLCRHLGSQTPLGFLGWPCHGP